MINDREQKERERLQKEADQVMKEFELPEMRELKPRLIGKSLTFADWLPENEKRGICKLFLRTTDGRYFIFSSVGRGGHIKYIDPKNAHEIMKRSDCKWYVTETEKKEFEIMNGS